MLSDLPSQSKGKMRSRIFCYCKLLSIAWIACLLVGIGGCSILPGHWRPGWNQPWPDGMPVPDTAGSVNAPALSPSP